MRANSKISRLLFPAATSALLFTLLLNTFADRAWGHASAFETASVDALSLRPGPPGPLTLGPEERLITILQTNDIHGGVEPQQLVQDPTAPPVGGMPLWIGIVQATRKGLQRQFGERAGVLLVDGGDQFQGTLISNYNEGQLTFSLMNEAQYDAVVPGNHDYDFGPIGWLEDQVRQVDGNRTERLPMDPTQDPRGALLRLVSQANFPLLSANTYLKNSLRLVTGETVEVDGIGCRVHRAGSRSRTPLSTRPETRSTVPSPDFFEDAATVDWNQAQTPEFLKRFKIVERAGLRVALIGIDTALTPSVTTAANVSDLCFREEVETLLSVREELDGKADLFVLLAHEGNTRSDFKISRLVERVLARRPGAIDAVVAGHTHFLNNTRVRGVPIVQSESGGDKFGRIDLVIDRTTKKVISSKTRTFAGVPMHPGRCTPQVESICEARGGVLSYEGEPVVASTEALSLIAGARREIEPIASRVLAYAERRVTRDRVLESPLANAMSDALRMLSGADVAMLNTGGLRANIEPGNMTYEQLFQVIPFSNHAVMVGPMDVQTVLSLLLRSAKSCGAYGALMQSGLMVKYERDCERKARAARAAVDRGTRANDIERGTRADIDDQAELIQVATVTGEVLFDRAKGGLLTPGRQLRVATLDFLSAGGSGYSAFRQAPVLQDFGILREGITNYYLSFVAKNALVHLNGKTDGRFTLVPPAGVSP